MEELPGEESERCPRCHTRARFRREELEAVDIPFYYARLAELERMNARITADIEEEGRRGERRDRFRLQALHMERQRVLSEFSFLSYFSVFQERW